MGDQLTDKKVRRERGKRTPRRGGDVDMRTGGDQKAPRRWHSGRGMGGEDALSLISRTMQAMHTRTHDTTDNNNKNLRKRAPRRLLTTTVGDDKRRTHVHCTLNIFVSFDFRSLGRVYK